MRTIIDRMDHTPPARSADEPGSVIRGSIIAFRTGSNIRLATMHDGGFPKAHRGEPEIEGADAFDAYCALRDLLAQTMCLACGDPLPGGRICHCENDE